jgi:hypothetical protein
MPPNSPFNPIARETRSGLVNGTFGAVERPFMIRPQYHFRNSQKGLLAWDVRRLVKLSEHLPVRRVKVSEIAEVDENHWYFYGNVTPTCRSIVEHCALIRDSDLSIPIILDQAGRVMDGMHRVCKAILEDEVDKIITPMPLISPHSTVDESP